MKSFYDGGAFRRPARSFYGAARAGRGVLSSLPAILTSRRALAAPATPTAPSGWDTYRVTLTDIDSTADGSLRYGISNTPPGGRLIVFDVTIDAQPATIITVAKPNVWIAAETAPGGVTLYGPLTMLRAMALNIMVSHVHFEVTGPHDSGDNTEDRDAAQIITGAAGDASNVEKIAFVNCTFSGATDEMVSSFPNANYAARLFRKHLFWRCAFFDPVGGATVRPGDPNHAYGPLVGSPALPALPVEETFFYECVFLSCRERHPRWGHGTSGWKINCLTVNYGRRPNELGYDATLNPYADAATGLAANAATSATVTITIASPGVVTWTSHGLQDNDPVSLSTDGALPTGLAAATIYYVRNKAANTFQLATEPGGTSINTSGTQSGTHTGYDVPYWPAYDTGSVFTYWTLGLSEVKGDEITTKLATRVSFVGNSEYPGRDTESTVQGVFNESVPPLSQVWWSNNYRSGAALAITAADITEATANGATDPTSGVVAHPVSLPANLSYFHDGLDWAVTVETDRATMEANVLLNVGARPDLVHFVQDRMVHEADTEQGARTTDTWRSRTVLSALAPTLSDNTVARYAKPGSVIGALTGFAENGIVPLLASTDGDRLDTSGWDITVGATGLADRRNIAIAISVQQDWYGQTPRQVSTPFTIQVSDDSDALSVDALATALTATRKWKAANVTKTGADCTAWADDLAAHSLAALSAPQYAASGTGCANPFVTFDGTDDAFRTAGGANPAGMASGTDPCWMVILFRENAATTDGQRVTFGYGGNGASDARWAGTISSGGTRKARYGKGTAGGVTDTVNTLLGAGFVLRVSNFEATPAVSGQVDGVATTAAGLAFNSATTGVRTAIGCNLASTAAEFAKADVAFVLYGQGNLDAAQMAEALKTGWAYLQGLVT